MHLYRNLGSITFESETPNFQIFSAEPQSYIIQSKSVTTPHDLFQQVSSFYRQRLHGQYVKSYSEQLKGNALVISQCKRVDTCKLDANALCQIMSEVAAIVNNVSKLIEGWIGDIQIQLLRCINGRITFVYIPCFKIQKHEEKEKTLSRVLAMANSLKNEEDVSSRLLIKKLGKCNSLADVIEEINYFSNIYAARKTNQCAIQFQGIKNNQKERPRRKLNILRMSQIMNKTRSTLFNNQQSFHFSQTRNSSSAIHISFPNKSHTKKQGSSLHSSCRSMRPSSTFKNVSSHASCSTGLRASQFIQQSKSKVVKQKTIRKQKQEVFANAVSPREEQKLLEKLKSKRASRTTPRTAQQPKDRNTSLVLEGPIKTQESNTQAICQPQCQPQKLKFEVKQKTNEIPQSFTIQNNRVDKKAAKLQPQKQKEAKLKKKAIVREEVINDELEVINLDKPHPKKETTIIECNSIDDQKTCKNSWNSKQKKEPPSDILENQSSLNSQKRLLQRLHNLDFIGAAVANTRAHLKNFQKIFWQLPMFFLYRQFYLKRVQLTQEMIKNRSNLSQCNELKQQNVKIEESIMKMINVVNRKQKQEDPHTLQQLKPYLNLDKRINCSAPIKTFVGQYIESMSEAIDNYPQLLTHSVEVIDALLVCKGIKINSDLRNKAMKEKDLQKYLNGQKRLLAEHS